MLLFIAHQQIRAIRLAIIAHVASWLSCTAFCSTPSTGKKRYNRTARGSSQIWSLTMIWGGRQATVGFFCGLVFLNKQSADIVSGERAREKLACCSSNGPENIFGSLLDAATWIAWAPICSRSPYLLDSTFWPCLRLRAKVAKRWRAPGNTSPQGSFAMITGAEGAGPEVCPCYHVLAFYFKAVESTPAKEAGHGADYAFSVSLSQWTWIVMACMG